MILLASKTDTETGKCWTLVNSVANKAIKTKALNFTFSPNASHNQKLKAGRSGAATDCMRLLGRTEVPQLALIKERIR